MLPAYRRLIVYVSLVARKCGRVKKWFLVLAPYFASWPLPFNSPIPVAQLWHVAVDHLSKTTLSEQDRGDQSTVGHHQAALRQGGESHDALYCPVCQAFVSMRDVN